MGGNTEKAKNNKAENQKGWLFLAGPSVLIALLYVFACILDWFWPLLAIPVVVAVAIVVFCIRNIVNRRFVLLNFAVIAVFAVLSVVWARYTYTEYIEIHNHCEYGGKHYQLGDPYPDPESSIGPDGEPICKCRTLTGNDWYWLCGD